MKQLLAILLFASVASAEFYVDDTECSGSNPGGHCNCTELMAFWSAQSVDRCQVFPQPISCCYPAQPPPPYARPDGQDGFVIAPPECQGAGHPAINANPLPHCTLAVWGDPNPPTFNGCDYANTAFEELSAECQTGFNSNIVNLNPPCEAIPWDTYFAVMKETPDPLHPDSGFQHWLASCRNLEQHMNLVEWLWGQVD